MRAATGNTENGEAVESQVVGERADVGGGVCNGAAGARIGEAVPGAVVRDETDAVVDRWVGMVTEAASGRSVVKNDRRPVGVAVLGVGEPSTVCRLERPLHAPIIRPRRASTTQGARMAPRARARVGSPDRLGKRG